MTKPIFISNGKTYDHKGEPLDIKVADENTEGSDLPEGFPERDLLVGSEFKTLDALRSATKEQLIAINGIGAAKANAILLAARK